MEDVKKHFASLFIPRGIEILTNTRLQVLQCHRDTIQLTWAILQLRGYNYENRSTFNEVI